MDTKTPCSHCKELKSDSEFTKRNGKVNHSLCKSCQNEMSRNYKRKNAEHISEYNKMYKSDKSDVIRKYNHKYNLENREKIQKRQTIQHAERRINDINYKISCNLRSRLIGLFKGKVHEHTLVLLGCTLDFLKKWFEFNFDDNMTFENYGKYWHIDHVIPCALFNISDTDEQYKCFHWSNLQPLEKIENLRKNDTLTKEIIDIQEKRVRRFLKKYKDELDDDTYTIIKYNKYAYLDV